VAEVTEQIAAFTAQLATIAADASAGEQELERAISLRESTAAEEQAAASAVPQLEAAVADAARTMADIQRRIGEVEQELRVADTQRENGEGHGDACTAA
jgi:chromosome segregation ATPase